MDRPVHDMVHVGTTRGDERQASFWRHTPYHHQTGIPATTVATAKDPLLDNMSTPNPRKKKRPREEEEEDIEDDTAAAMAGSATPPGISPQMQTRAVRSARKAKKETTSAAVASQTEEVGDGRRARAKKPKLKHGGDDDDDDDDSKKEEDADMGEGKEAEGSSPSELGDDAAMEEDQDETNEQPSSTTTEAVAAAAATRPAPGTAPMPRGPRVPARAAARLLAPSQVQRSLRATAAPVVQDSQLEPRTSEDAVPAPPLPQRLNLRRTPAAKKKQAAAAPPTSPSDAAPDAPTTVPTQVPEETNDNDEPPVQNGQAADAYSFRLPPWLDHSLSQPWTCFMVLGLLMLPRLLIVHPFLDSAVHTSRILVPFYKGLFGSRIMQAEVPSVPPDGLPAGAVLSEDTKAFIKESEHLNQAWKVAKDVQARVLEELMESRRILDEKSESLEKQVEALDAASAGLQDSLQAALSMWQDHFDKLTRIEALSTKGLVTHQDFNENDFLNLQNSLGEAESRVVLNAWNLSIWNPPLETCEVPDLDGVSSSDEDANTNSQSVVVTKESVLQHWNELERELDSEYRALQKDQELRHEIAQWIHNFADDLPLPDYDEPDLASLRHLSKTKGATMGTHGPGGQEIRQLVEARLEVDRADGTGEVDYAALFQGSSVVRFGPYATSPSLADRLPLFNRLMALIGSQFYGYGPEAALTPLYQPDALGQCWAFVQEEPANKFGSYAVLTVKLAKPIFVSRISIDHVFSDRKRGPNSTVRDFRLFGFVDLDGTADPISLGSFVFEADSGRGLLRQEFDVDSNENMPKFGAVSLVVDSTRGADYTCLYRFRVHGDD
jgi:hypothetical protein